MRCNRTNPSNVLQRKKCKLPTERALILLLAWHGETMKLVVWAFGPWLEVDSTHLRGLFPVVLLGNPLLKVETSIVVYNPMAMFIVQAAMLFLNLVRLELNPTSFNWWTDNAHRVVL
jgi:hypothetical protein